MNKFRRKFSKILSSKRILCFLLAVTFTVTPWLTPSNGTVRKVLLMGIGVLFLELTFVSSSIMKSFNTLPLRKKISLLILFYIFGTIILLMLFRVMSLIYYFVILYLFVGAIQNDGGNDYSFVLFTEISAYIVFIRNFINYLFSYSAFKSNSSSAKELIDNMLYMFFSLYIGLCCDRILVSHHIFNKHTKTLVKNAYNIAIGKSINGTSIPGNSIIYFIISLIIIILVWLFGYFIYNLFHEVSAQNNS